MPASQDSSFAPARLRAARVHLYSRRAANDAVARVLFAPNRLPERPGVSVVIANWNTLSYLQVTVDAVRRFSPGDTDVIVVDNGSRDGSREWLATRPDIRALRAPWNFGHGLALDVGVRHARTTHVVTLDVDAFPFSPTWLDASMDALDGGAKISGAVCWRNFIHPSFLVTTRQLLLRGHLSFRPQRWSPAPSDNDLPVFLDVGEAVSQAISVKYGDAALHRIAPVERDGPCSGGTVFGNVVYHNWCARDGRPHVARAWAEAVSCHLGPR